MSHGRKPTRNLDALRVTYAAPEEHKKKVKERATVPLSCEYDQLSHVHEKFGGTKPNEDPPEPVPPKLRKSKNAMRPYAELHAASAFSFLDSASLPEDLM